MLKRILLLAVVASACAPKSAKSSLNDDDTPIDPESVTISLQHRADGPEWTLHYEFSEPVPGVLFRPVGGNFRQAHWQAVGPANLEWHSFDGVEFLAGANGELIKTLDFTFDRFSTGSDDEPIRTFADGSAAISSSPLAAYKMEKHGAEWTLATRFLANFILTPKAGEHVMANAEESTKPLGVAESPRSIGTYFYFGKLKLETHEGIPFLIDPGIQPGTSAAAVDAVGRAFQFFQVKFGTLSFTPSVVLNHTGADSDGNGAGGAAAWGQFVVDVSGHTAPSPAESEVILNAVVHETAHFWNALEYQSKDTKALLDTVPESNTPTWIYEGGAQALTLEAMRALKLLTEERYQQKRAELIGLCATVLGSKRVIDADGDPQMVWAPYHCGEMLQFLIVDQARKTQPDFDIFSLWLALYRASQEKQYDNGTFFAVVKAVVPGISDEKLTNMKKVLVSTGDQIPALVVSIVQ